jgi:hypothetical protein
MGLELRPYGLRSAVAEAPQDVPSKISAHRRCQISFHSNQENKVGLFHFKLSGPIDLSAELYSKDSMSRQKISLGIFNT